MKNSSTLTPIAQRRTTERGAALITMLLISMLLLAAGTTLFFTTSMYATSAIDSTAETQAYYAAEAGLEATLDALRGNVAPDPSLPSGTTMSFRTAVTLLKSNKAGDLSTVPRLSGWLQYSSLAANSTVSLGTNLSYKVAISDPDNTPVANEPSRLLVAVTGYGPRGAMKQMQIIASTFSFQANGMFYLRHSDDGTAMHFSVSNSAAQLYTGQDRAVPTTFLPTIGVSSIKDRNVANTADIKKDVIADTPQTAIVSVPWFLQTADVARAFLNDLKTRAIAMNRYFTTLSSGQAGSTTAPAFTFVDGDTELVDGAGLLVVTGNLHIGAADQFSGIILVLSEGTGYGDVATSGGKNEVYGCIYAASFYNTGGFLAPWWDTKNGGSLKYQYDSSWVLRASRTLGVKVDSVVEY